jgi:hypothetical protein
MPAFTSPSTARTRGPRRAFFIERPSPSDRQRAAQILIEHNQEYGPASADSHGWSEFTLAEDGITIEEKRFRGDGSPWAVGERSSWSFCKCRCGHVDVYNTEREDLTCHGCQREMELSSRRAVRLHKKFLAQ